MSARLTPGGAMLADVVVAHLNLTARRILGRFDVSVGVYNLFGERYASPVGGEYLQNSIEQDGRSYRLKVTGRF